MLVTTLCVFHVIRNMTLEPRLETSKKIDKPELSKATATGRPNSLKVVHGTSVSEMGSQMSTSDSENQKQDDELQSLAADVYDIIKDIQDPEKPNTLEELNVVFEEGIHMTRLHDMEDAYTVHIAFTPTVPHCSLATLIGLCIRVKLERSLPFKHKVDITITEGTHSTEESINKQINDKERIAAAMENPNLKELVEKCIKEEDY